mgnify:CR=1 FL=1
MSNVLENWKAKTDELIRDREEIASWARRILGAIEKGRLAFAFDPDRDDENDTGLPLHAATWFDITEKLSIWAWSFETWAECRRTEEPECWGEALKLARAAWEDEARARVRSELSDEREAGPSQWQSDAHRGD